MILCDMHDRELVRLTKLELRGQLDDGTQHEAVLRVRLVANSLPLRRSDT
jgi:hypothetical protein